MQLSFESDIARWSRSLTDLQRRQLPFATAKALTDTARLDVKPAIETRIGVAFDRPTPFTRRGVAWLAAYKDTLVASVMMGETQRGYLRLQERGGERRPAGRALVVPVGARLNAYGNLPKGALKRAIARGDTFVGEVKGVGGVWQRRGRSVVLLVRFHDRASYRPRFAFGRTARDAADRAFPRRFAAALDLALRTAR